MFFRNIRNYTISLYPRSRIVMADAHHLGSGNIITIVTIRFY